MVLHGLHISPDIDTVTYTLAGLDNRQTGWGLAGETLDGHGRARGPGRPVLVPLGDRDLATHLYRTQRLGEGATLSEVTAELAAARGVSGAAGARCPTTRCAPGSPWPTAAAGRPRRSTSRSTSCGCATRWRWRAVRFAGAEAARPAPGVLEAIAGGGAHRGLPLEPGGLDRPAAGRPRHRRRPGRPATRRGGGVAHRGRGGAQGPGRPAPGRARPRGVGGGGGPPLRAAGPGPWWSTRPTPTWPARWRPRGVRCVVAPTVMSSPAAGGRPGPGGARCRWLRRPVRWPSTRSPGSARCAPATTWRRLLAGGPGRRRRPAGPGRRRRGGGDPEGRVQGRGAPGGPGPRRPGGQGAPGGGRGGPGAAPARRPAHHRDGPRVRLRQRRGRPVQRGRRAPPPCCRSTRTARPGASGPALRPAPGRRGGGGGLRHVRAGLARGA